MNIGNRSKNGGIIDFMSPFHMFVPNAGKSASEGLIFALSVSIRLVLLWPWMFDRPKYPSISRS